MPEGVSRLKDLENNTRKRTGLTRRAFLWTLVAGTAGGVSGTWLLRLLKSRKLRADSFIASLSNYRADISGTIRSGFRELGISASEIKGKRILLKPNLVESNAGATHINTHPLVIHGAFEAFMACGAAEVLVGEGTAHYRDSLLLLEETGLVEVLVEDRIRFVDFNYDEVYSVTNAGGNSRLKELVFPETLQKVDWIVSMAKMKTHHWASVTLSMKNLFGVMPGSYYGWPKNVLHWAGINKTILDIYATLRPHLTIVDGIIGMEGDGPIMGTPHPAGVLVMGRNFPAVDATCARIMGVNPRKVSYLAAADGKLGTIRESSIQQKGEAIASVRTDFALVDKIPSHKGIRL
jgi:uncharacterized protein (DUF362 family)